MARIRYLKPEFFTDEDLAELPFEVRLTFAGLWCYADKAGRLEDRPKYLKAMIFPYDNVNIDKALEKLSAKFIQRYEANGKKYIQIMTWDKHQRPHNTEKESAYPKPPPQSIVYNNIYLNMLKSNIKRMGRGPKAGPTLNNVHITVKDEKSKKKRYLDCVLLTDDEYMKLQEKAGGSTADRAITILNNYIMSNGKKYKSHYHAILNWALDRAKEEKNKQQSRF